MTDQPPRRADGTFTPRPASGYTWPPFEPGNVAALRHGAAHVGTLSPLAERFAAEVVEVAPWLGRVTRDGSGAVTRNAFSGAVEAWAWAEAACSLYRQHFDEHGLIDPESGEPARGVERWERAERRAASARERLGLDPSSLSLLMARLAAAVTAVRQLAPGDDGLDELAREGRRVLERAAARDALAPGDSDGGRRGD